MTHFQFSPKIESMTYIKRLQEHQIHRALSRGKSILLLGARQTGKTTMVCKFTHQLHLNFIRPDVRQRYEKFPSALTKEVEAMNQADVLNIQPVIILDEVQRIPEILDVVQDLIDRKLAKFILTGSSARKLRRQGRTNLLPGRVLALRLDPLCMHELMPNDLHQALVDGTLPGISSIESSSDRELDLASYVTTYLEQEVRSEAIVRNLGHFARFLEYAAIDSGRVINTSKLSQEIGVSHTTIRSYFQILEDCLITERIEPITNTQTRKRLTRSSKYLFFDLGVRRLAARENRSLPRETMGHLFEQFIGLELIRLSRMSNPNWRVRFWRDPNGPEVDWVLETDEKFIPIEVKYNENPTEKDARHLHVFLNEYTNTDKGFVICRTPRPMQLSRQVIALPWQYLWEIIG